MASIPTFKCVIVGDGGVGKTTFLQKHYSGEFTQMYKPTLGVEVDPIVLDTTVGPVRLNIWDVAGQQMYRGLGEGYYVQAEGAIVMFDLTKEQSYENSNTWFNGVTNECQNIPIVVVGNKYDMVQQHEVNNVTNDFGIESDMYCEISSKTGYNIDKPLITLIRKLMHNDTI